MFYKSLNDRRLYSLMLPTNLGKRSFAEGDDAGGGGDGDKDGDKSGDGDTVSKADFDALQAKYDQSGKDLEDMRGEVMSSDYLDFLDAKDKGDPKSDADKKKDDSTSDEDWENMSKKDLYTKARADAKKDLQGDIDKITTDRDSDRKSSNRAEVARFSRAHDDYETYRPTMYGLSRDPKNADLSIQELYDRAKEHVAGIHTKTSDTEKKRQEKLKGEKPGDSTSSYESTKDLSSAEATKQAADEVEKELGPIPSA